MLLGIDLMTHWTMSPCSTIELHVSLVDWDLNDIYINMLIGIDLMTHWTMSWCVPGHCPEDWDLNDIY